MNEKRYFIFTFGKTKIAHAFPSLLRAVTGFENKIEEAYISLDFCLQNGFKEVTEDEFLKVYNEAHSNLTVRYHNQFSTENQFIKNEFFYNFTSVLDILVFPNASSAFS